MACTRSRVRAPLAPLLKPSAMSTRSPSAPIEFRNRFGYWMERAAAGDEILITRRGRRFAPLGPADPRLATTGTAPAPEPVADREALLPVLLVLRAERRQPRPRLGHSRIPIDPTTCTQASSSSRPNSDPRSARPADLA